MDAKTELVSETGHIKHAALTLYGYFCKLRNGQTGLCFPKPPNTAKAIGIPRTNVIMLTKFLDEKNWIQFYDTGVIRPLKGFYPPEEIFRIKMKDLFEKPLTCLIIRQICLINRQTCLMIRHLFKGSINQPNKPAQLTSVSANPPAATLQRAPDDKKSEDQPAGKPAPQAPAGKPADGRMNHPAVIMVKNLTGRFPPKDLWDRIIREIRGKPDIEFFRASWEIWRSVGGNPQNFEQWLFEPNRTKMPPEIYAQKNGKPPPERNENAPKVVLETPTERDVGARSLIPLDEKVLQCHLLDFQVMEYSAEQLSELENNYEPEAWAYLMKEIEKCKAATS